MLLTQHPIKTLLLSACAAFLTACGGGGGSSTTTSSDASSGTGDAMALPTDTTQASAAAATTSFTLTPGWWWNSAEGGSGYAIEQQGNQIFMAAFLYETSGAPTWYVSTLTLGSGATFTGALTRYSGGQSLLGAYQSPTSTTVVGNATLTFNSASVASLQFTPPGGAAATRTTALTRFGISTPAYATSAGSFENGWWWNEAEGGRGYFVEAQSNQAFVGSFMYDTTGEPLWYVSSATLPTALNVSGPLAVYRNGQSLFGSYRTPAADNSSPGTMGFEFANANSGTLRLPDNRGVPIKRFVFNTGTQVALTVGAVSASNGKTLYGQWCSACHGSNPALNRDKVLLGANQASVILNAINTNKGSMGILKGQISSSDASDLAAYLATPTL